MTATRTHHCSQCEADREFYRAASMEVHIGTKVKWHCRECDYEFVRIDGDVNTATA